MIIHEARIDNAWFRAATGWFAAILLACIVAIPTFDYILVDLLRLWPLVIAIPQGAFLLYKLGKWTRPPTRVIGFAAIIGLFFYLPLLAALLMPVFALLFTNETIAARAIFIALLLIWVAANVRHARSLVIKTEFIEREFNVEADRILRDRAPKTNLKTARLDKSYWPVALLVYAIPTAYLAQRLAHDHTGPRGTLLQVAVLATPLAIHILGHLARGSYLWGHMVWALERKHGKPVHLAWWPRST